jgi:hypothetical protein
MRIIFSEEDLAIAVQTYLEAKHLPGKAPKVYDASIMEQELIVEVSDADL